MPAPQLQVGLVADASREEQEQREWVVDSSNSLQLETWGAFQAEIVSVSLTLAVITCRL